MFDLDVGESVQGEFYEANVYLDHRATCTLLARWVVATYETNEGGGAMGTGGDVAAKLPC